MDERKTFTLLELTQSLQRAVEHWYSQPYWVKAEMHKLNLSSKGHCYPELVQKENGQVLAQMRGTIWSARFQQIRLQFEQTVKEPLRDGLTLLFQVKVTFHPVYGMGLDILDIDPNYTLGELHREREETLKKLKDKNLLNKNQQLELPLLPKNIAIISVASSKGLSDFLSVLNGNEFGYRFNTHLFPAVLNGDKAVETISAQLEKIRKFTSFFDTVVIVRGGGEEVGMTCYNNYDLCALIASFPLPILTGIGHSTNMTVAEIIAYRNAITPTQLADFFVKTFRAFDENVMNANRFIQQEAEETLKNARRELLNATRIFRNSTFASLIGNSKQLDQSKAILKKEIKDFHQRHTDLLSISAQNLRLKTRSKCDAAKIRLDNQQKGLSDSFRRFLFEQNNQLLNYQMLLLNRTPNVLDSKREKLLSLEKTVKLVDPANVLKKGYTLTLFHDKLLSETNFPIVGDEVETITAVGKLKSKVLTTKK